MALTDYPVLVNHADYAQPAAMDEPVPPVGTSELAVSITGFTKLKRAVKSTTLRPAAVTHPGITAVRFVNPGSKIGSQSFTDALTGAKQDPLAPNDAAELPYDPQQAFCFAPGVDDPLIALNVLNTADVVSLRFELFCKRDNTTAFWTRDWTGDDLKRLLKHPIVPRGQTVHRGSLPLSELVGDLDDTVTIGGDPDPAFPDKVLTVHYSPYQLRVTVVGGNGHTAYPSVAWTYIHVVAHAIRLDWFAFKRQDHEKLALMLPVGRRDRELRLYDDLRNSKDRDNLGASFPAPGDVKMLPIDGNRFFREENELQDNSGYEQWKQHWGDGPNVPLRASVLIRDMAGRGVEAPLALGNSWLLWSYKDAAQPLSHEGVGLGPGGAVPADAGGTIAQFLTDSQDYLTAAPGDSASPSGRNCHVHRGGKRGAGAVPVFPPQPGHTDEPLPAAGDLVNDPQRFPFKVEACATRKWAVRSKFRSTGELAGQTGVVFQPSRMAGDAYTLQVAIVTADLYAELDVINEAALDASPVNLVHNSGTLAVWRKITFARYMNGVDVVIDYDLVREKMARNFMRLDVAFNKPEKLKMAALHRAYEEVRTDPASPLEDYVRAAMLTPVQLQAALERDVNSEGDIGGKNDIAGYCIPFRSYRRWKEAMITLHGDWDTAVTWSNNYAHAQPDYWRARGEASEAPRAPILGAWPSRFRRHASGVGPVGQLVVKISPYHTDLRHTGTIVANTKTVILPTGDLDDPLRAQLATAWNDVYIHVGYGGNDVYHPADAGVDNRATIPRNTPIKVKVTGHTVDPAKYRAIKDHITSVAQARADGQMLPAYQRSSGYQWVFAILAEMNAKLLGPGVGGITVVSLPAHTLTNYHHPNGKAMFANVARTGACIPIMNSNDDTLYHEFSHCMFLNHGDQPPNDQFKLHQDGWTGTNLMHTGERQGQLDGFLMLRTRGWSFLQTDAAGAVIGNCYPDVNKPGKLAALAGADPEDQNYWAGLGGAVRTLFRDGASNSQ
jgi:hypothetical protein